MIGEIRDFETAEIGVKAALTGHLVLSTLHTNDAPGTVSRLLNMGIEPFMVTASLNLILAQRLMRGKGARPRRHQVDLVDGSHGIKDARDEAGGLAGVGRVVCHAAVEKGSLSHSGPRLGMVSCIR
jgi:type II secretory ATPase GspE/PulE/Tfp pilus assembly ATPase PilB-like protein